MSISNNPLLIVQDYTPYDNTDVEANNMTCVPIVKDEAGKIDYPKFSEKCTYNKYCMGFSHTGDQICYKSKDTPFVKNMKSIFWKKNTAKNDAPSEIMIAGFVLAGFGFFLLLLFIIYIIGSTIREKLKERKKETSKKE